MTEITMEMLECCYDYTKRVYLDGLNREDAITEICVETFMDYYSAKRYIGAIIKLIRGERYSAVIKSEFYSLLLDKIQTDFGDEGVMRALNAMKEHIYQNKRPMNEAQNIVNIYGKKFGIRIMN